MGMMNTIDGVGQYADFIDFYYRSNYGTFTEYMRQDGCDLAFSKYVDSFYFNQLILYRGHPEAVLKKYAAEFEKRGRQPLVYLTPLSEFYEKPMDDTNLIAMPSDSWMLLEAKEYRAKPRPSSVDVVQVDEKDHEDYLQTFQNGFSNPDDVYGNLPAGFTEIERQFLTQPSAMKNIHLMAKVDGKPAGVVHAVIEGELCFLYALAVPLAYRQRGDVAKALGDEIIQQCIKQGAVKLLLQTEKNSKLERFYRRNGFKRIFCGYSYMLRAE